MRSAVGHGEPETTSNPVPYGAHLFWLDVIVDLEKYFEPRLLEIYIFHYEMKKNRDAFL